MVRIIGGVLALTIAAGLAMWVVEPKLRENGEFVFTTLAAVTTMGFGATAPLTTEGKTVLMLTAVAGWIGFGAVVGWFGGWLVEEYRTE